MRSDHETQRQVVRLVLKRERERAGLERMLGPDAMAAVKTLAADGVVVRCGELLWASPALCRLKIPHDKPKRLCAPAERAASSPQVLRAWAG
jgi:hypothetical protein